MPYQAPSASPSWKPAHVGGLAGQPPSRAPHSPFADCVPRLGSRKGAPNDHQHSKRSVQIRAPSFEFVDAQWLCQKAQRQAATLGGTRERVLPQAQLSSELIGKAEEGDRKLADQTRTRGRGGAWCAWSCCWWSGFCLCGGVQRIQAAED